MKRLRKDDYIITTNNPSSADIVEYTNTNYTNLIEKLFIRHR